MSGLRPRPPFADRGTNEMRHIMRGGLCPEIRRYAKIFRFEGKKLLYYTESVFFETDSVSFLIKTNLYICRFIPRPNPFFLPRKVAYLPLFRKKRRALPADGDTPPRPCA